MSFITREDLTSHIYDYKIDVITQGDDTKLDDAIKAAESQAKRYLSRFNIDEIFAAEGDDRDKYFDLILYIKDLAKWHLLRVSNAGVDLSLAKECYNDAIDELEKIQRGRAVATDWPLAESEDTPNQSFQIRSNKKRGNYY